MQIKTTVRYHLTPVRMAIINKPTNNKCWQVCGERATIFTVCGNADWCSPCGEQYGEIPQKIKELCFNTEIPLQGIYLKEPKILI